MQGREVAIVIGGIVLLILLLGLLGGGMMMGPWMMGYGWGGYGFGWWGIVMGIAMLLFWLLIIGGAVWLVISLFRQGRTAVLGPGPTDHALDILRERYARGEITREQFEQMRHDIEGK